MTENVDAPKHRIESLDILRGAAIIGVITVHILLGAGRNVDSVSNGFNFAELAYAGLPMFIIISGYLHRCGRSFTWNLEHRVIPLLITLFISVVVLTTAMYGYLYLLGYDLSQYNLFDDIMTVLIGKCLFQTIGTDTFNAGAVLSPFDISAGFYYLQIIAVGYLIFYAVVDRIIDDWRKTAAVIAALVAVTGLYLATINIQLPFSAQLGPIVAAFLLTGALLRKYNIAEYLENGYREARYWIILLAAVVIGVLMILYFPTGMKMYNSYFGEYGPWSVLPFYVFAISCGAVLWYVAVLLIRVPIVSDVFRFAGISSLVFYTQHMFIAKIIAAPFATLGTDFWITVNSDGQRFVLLMTTLVIISLLVLALDRLHKSAGKKDVENDDADYSRS